jgi:hypothetical protein
MMNRPAAIEYEAAQPWDRQPGEGGRAFAAFRIYRDLGPVERSLAWVARASGKSLTWMKEWSRRNRWVGRAAAWDAENQRISRAQHTKGIEEMSRRQARIGQLAQQRAWQRLTEMTAEEAKAMSISEAIRLMELGTHLERDAFAGLSVAGSVPAFAPIGVPTPPQNTIVEYLREHPDRLEPVLGALRQLRAALPELDPARDGDEAVRDDGVDVEDEEGDGDEEGPMVPPKAEGSSNAVRLSEPRERSTSARRPDVAEGDGIPRAMPGFRTRRDPSLA